MSSIFLNGWDPAGILKNLTPELVRFSQSTTQQVGILSRAVMVAVTTASPAVVHHVTSPRRVYLTFSFKATSYLTVLFIDIILVFAGWVFTEHKC